MRLKILPVILFISLLSDVHAQFGPPGGGGGGRGGGAMGRPPRSPFSGQMKEVFGNNSAFSANMQMDTKGARGAMTVPAKIAFLDGKSRFEMDMAKMKSESMPAGTAEQMKAMGMGEMVTISRPDKKENYFVYPGLKSYAVVPTPDEDNSAAKPDIKKTELGKETVDGHPTTKYKMVIKDTDGKEQEATVWNASDLKDFPVKIEMNTEMGPSTVTFSDVKLSKPDDSSFDPPTGFQRYNDLATMMRETMMKRFAQPGAAFPPPNK